MHTSPSPPVRHFLLLSRPIFPFTSKDNTLHFFLLMPHNKRLILVDLLLVCNLQMYIHTYMCVYVYVYVCVHSMHMETGHMHMHTGQLARIRSLLPPWIWNSGHHQAWWQVTLPTHWATLTAPYPQFKLLCLHFKLKVVSFAQIMSL